MRLKATDIEYLAFEGGGGKGFAYLGALTVLESADALRKVKGFAGASAGAITAFLLSIGMTAAEIKKYLVADPKRFDAFWEPPDDPQSGRPRVIPQANGAYAPRSTTLKEKIRVKALELVKQTKPTTPPVVGLVIGKVLQRFAPAPLAVFMEHWPKMLTFSLRDMGFFPGLAPRTEFQHLLRDAQGRLSNLATPVPFMTFKQHYDIFKKHLVLTGSNLSTGKTQIFSAAATADFPVVDAVRISMGLPYVFKPYVIQARSSDDRGKWPTPGTYVDGGLWNNAPMRELEGEQALGKSLNVSSTFPDPQAINKTLLIRLEIDKERVVDDLLSLMAAVTSLTGTGESQVSERYHDQILVLDTQGLGLLDFSPKPEVQRVVNDRSAWAMENYLK